MEDLAKADASTGRAALVSGRAGGKLGLEPGKNVAEGGGGHGELDGMDSELGSELAKVGDAVPASEIDEQ